ncbi:3-deoxy-D-manno-octulosonic acid transferase [Orenia metallireducens]|uniref:3-deoxy-D-manno-octulosonic acid transferase n=1 Tax=Orenia metallireducens TaxID=1413210 RepID=A0A1C0A651_9FIRM|nr:3-deoxy-D-manno-octulosonic acid transferase [Orenia metallireducens]OCL25589.1 3-deoxy-D-manno-octulosonic acid transferase [Orenia metallireducens]
MSVAYFTYNFLVFIILLLYSPILIYRVLINKEDITSLLERFGFLSKDIIRRFKGEKVIWVHAASVGEAGAASPVVAKLKQRFPEYKIVFSSMTNTGRNMAQKIIKEADGFIYIPFDFFLIIGKVLKAINPELLLIMETELWPNLIKYSKKQGAKVMLVSGRISDSSFKQYKYLGPLLKNMFDQIDILSMQSQKDMDRIIKLGADEDKVCNNGNTKFDQEYGRVDSETKKAIYREFKLDPKQAIIVAGSTHDNEEEQLISLYKELKIKFDDLVLLLVPRYIDRVEEIESLYNQAGINTIRRSRVKDRDSAKQSVILVDTIGELAKLYGIADLVFVGGSLIERGGHNILEPASLGKLVFFGPHMFNFKDSTKLLLENKVGIQVTNVSELIEQMEYYLSNSNILEEQSRQAIEMIKDNQGASWRNIKLISRLLEGRKELSK